LDARELIEAAGLDPAEVTLSVRRRRLGRGTEVEAALADGSMSSIASFYGTPRDNAEAALVGLVDLLNDGAS
jgi:hypothetical protein